MNPIYICTQTTIIYNSSLTVCCVQLIKLLIASSERLCFAGNMFTNLSYNLPNMNVNAFKDYSPKIKSAAKNATAQSSQNNITNKSLNMLSKKTTSIIKSNNKTLSTKIQSSLSTSLTNDKAVVARSTVTSLSTTVNTFITNEPITNVENNSTICDYTSDLVALNNTTN